MRHLFLFVALISGCAYDAQEIMSPPNQYEQEHSVYPGEDLSAATSCPPPFQFILIQNGVEILITVDLPCADNSLTNKKASDPPGWGSSDYNDNSIEGTSPPITDPTLGPYSFQ